MEEASDRGDLYGTKTPCMAMMLSSKLDRDARRPRPLRSTKSEPRMKTSCPATEAITIGITITNVVAGRASPVYMTASHDADGSSR